MQSKIMVTKHIGIDMTYWMCLMFVMPMIFFFAALLNVWREGLDGEHIEVLVHALSKGMFYCNMFITSIFIGAKKF